MNAVTTTRQTTGERLHGVADGLFSLGDWHIVAIAEGIQGSEIIHFCNCEDKTGVPIRWCYQHWNDTTCPGCDEVQPDEIQALDQMMNVDRTRLDISRLIDKSMKEVFWHGFKDLTLKGNGL
jgi:hypothetical protein